MVCCLRFVVSVLHACCGWCRFLLLVDCVLYCCLLFAVDVVLLLVGVCRLFVVVVFGLRLSGLLLLVVGAAVAGWLLFVVSNVCGRLLYRSVLFVARCVQLVV